MKKLPRIYQNELNKKINNNKKVFDGLKEEVTLVEGDRKIEEVNSKYDKLTVHEKLQELINQSSYIFNTPVILVFETREEKCQIAGVVNNHIITMDNKIVKINELRDIKILK